MPWSKDDIAVQVALDLEEGWYVNLGVGLPSLLIDKVPADREVVLHSENGILGVRPLVGEADEHLVHAGSDYVSLRPGAAVFDSVTSFSMIRGGRLDVTVLGAYEVTPGGDLANWRGDSDDLAGRIGAIGGAADLAVGARQVWVMMRHRTAGGAPKIVDRCRLPLTARSAVTRIYTDWAVFGVTGGPLRVRGVAPGVSPDDLRAHTAGELQWEV